MLLWTSSHIIQVMISWWIIALHVVINIQNYWAILEKVEFANSVDLAEATHEPTHLELHYLNSQHEIAC